MKKIIAFFGFLAAVLFGYQEYQNQNTTTPPQNNQPSAEKPSTQNRQRKPKTQIPSDALKITAWNLGNFGRSKNQEELVFIHKILQSSDVVGISEVSKTYFGTQAVADLVDLLDRTGTNWDYAVSEATSGAGSERYALLWKSNKVSLKSSSLEKSVARTINREPFTGTFKFNQKIFNFSIFHAVPEGKFPEKENAQLHKLADVHQNTPLLIGGDFNENILNQSFENIKAKGFSPALFRVLTTLKLRKTSTGRHLANPYDNILYKNEDFQIFDAYAEDFTVKFSTLTLARRISDHLPVHLVVKMK